MAKRWQTFCRSHSPTIWTGWVIGLFLFTLAVIYIQAACVGELSVFRLHISAVMDDTVRSIIAAVGFLLTGVLFAWAQTCQEGLPYSTLRTTLAASTGVFLVLAALVRSSQLSIPHKICTILLLSSMFALGLVWVSALRKREMQILKEENIEKPPLWARGWPLLGAITAVYAVLVVLLAVDNTIDEPTNYTTAVIEFLILIFFSMMLFSTTSV